MPEGRPTAGGRRPASREAVQPPCGAARTPPRGLQIRRDRPGGVVGLAPPTHPRPVPARRAAGGGVRPPLGRYESRGDDVQAAGTRPGQHNTAPFWDGAGAIELPAFALGRRGLDAPSPSCRAPLRVRMCITEVGRRALGRDRIWGVTLPSRYYRERGYPQRAPPRVSGRHRRPPRFTWGSLTPLAGILSPSPLDGVPAGQSPLDGGPLILAGC